jgi:hypothetical protein
METSAKREMPRGGVRLAPNKVVKDSPFAKRGQLGLA